jgi:hypothetical protein
MDWCATHFLPAPKPIGVKIRGYDVTRLDIATAIGGVLIAFAAVWWYGQLGWFVIAVLLFGMMWLWMW